MKKILSKVLTLFNKREKINFFKILFLSFIGAIFEAISVGALFPFVSSLSGTKNVKYLDFFAKLGLKNLSAVDIFYYGLICLFTLYLIKSIYLSFLTWLQMGFLYKNSNLFSQNLFAKYLTKDYLFHVNINSSQLMRNITTEINIYLTYFLQAGLNMLTECMVVLLLITLLIIVEPVSAVFMLIIFLCIMWFSNRYLGGKVTNWGVERQLAEGDRMRVLKEGFGSIKEVIVFSSAEYFFNKFRKADDLIANLARKQATFMQLPRIWLEIFAFFVLCLISITMINMDKSFQDIISVLVIYSAVSFRLLPSFSRIMGSIQSIKYSLPVLEMLKKDVGHLENNIVFKRNMSKIKFKEKIELNNIWFQYSNEKKYIIENLNVSIKKGEIIGLVGKSAAGKSTLIDIFLGLLKPSNGQILMDGKCIESFLESWQSIIGYVPQSVFISDENLISNVAFGIPENEIDLNRVIFAVKFANLEVFLENNYFGLYQKVGDNGIQLSGGQRQRIGIARAMYNNPEILVLDEATSALDAQTENEIFESLSKLKNEKTILIISHKESTLKICNVIYQIINGRLAIK